MLLQFLAQLRLKVERHTTHSYHFGQRKIEMCKHILQWDSSNLINFASFENHLEGNNDTLNQENIFYWRFIHSTGQSEIVLLDKNSFQPDI